MSAYAIDADNAGYLGYEEGLAVQNLRIELNMCLEETALRLLELYPSTSISMQFARTELRKTSDGLQTVEYHVDEAELIQNYLSQLEPVIARWATRSAKRRSFEIQIHKHPTIGRLVISLTVSAVGTGIILAVSWVFGS